MVIDGAWVEKIFRLWKDKKYEIAKEEVFKYRMRNYHKLKRIEDKVFLDYRMAHLEYILNNKDVANYYFKLLEEIFSDSYNRSSMEYDYYRYKWLYINNNQDTLNEKEIIDGMMDICNYYNRMGNEKMMKMAYGNILRFKEDENKMLETLQYILESNQYYKINFLSSVLKDCENISHNLYIKALDIVNRYEININVV